MRLGKRERIEALLQNPVALAAWVERKRNRELTAIVKSNEGLRPERLNWRKDKSFDTDYTMGKAMFGPREMRAAIGSTKPQAKTCKRWSMK